MVNTRAGTHGYGAESRASTRNMTDACDQMHAMFISIKLFFRMSVLIVSPVKDQDDHFPVKCAVQIGMTSFITRVSRIETYEKDVYFDVQFSGPPKNSRPGGII